jgi:predicted alpha/beta-fold hydrolase
MTPTPYRPPWWLPGAHLQTIWPLARKGPPPAWLRERWETPDGDFIDLDWLAGGPAGAPLVVLFHGLEGSSDSHYARALMRAVAARGWRGVVPHFRGCSGEPNRLPRSYHSGDSEEIDWILRRLRRLAGGATLYAVGVSLGGNALLKWLGEEGDGARGVLAAAAAVCPPLDLAICGHALAQGFNRVYTRHFLATLKPKALAKLARHPGLADRARIVAARTLFEFDDAYTGPVHGFAGAADYWRRASARPWLRGIRIPTLLLVAANDPFVPPAALPRTSELSPAIRFECPAAGGHVGFLDAPWPGGDHWLPARLLAHFAHAGR